MKALPLTSKAMVKGDSEYGNRILIIIISNVSYNSYKCKVYQVMPSIVRL